MPSLAKLNGTKTDPISRFGIEEGQNARHRLAQLTVAD